MKFFKAHFYLAIFLAFLTPALAKAEASFQFICVPEQKNVCTISQGEAGALIIISSEPLNSIQGEIFTGQILFKKEDKKGRIWSALFGADMEQAQGKYLFKLKATTSGGENINAYLTILVQRKEFPSEYLTLPEKMVKFSPEVYKRVVKDNKTVLSVTSHFTPQIYWKGEFIRPVSGYITSPFGVRRIINGEKRSAHTGVDLHAQEGEEILASNYGKVALVYEGYLLGKSIVIDHGSGLYTVYYHLSEIKIKQGEMVEKGKVIGLAGATGRATAPHLHFGVKLNQARIDPMSLLNVSQILSERIRWLKENENLNSF